MAPRTFPVESRPRPSKLAEKNGLIILDARGRIQFCSDHPLFADGRGRLLGHSIMHLVPGLPLREATPGYNIAYVRLSFSEQEWQRQTVMTAGGSFRDADVSLRLIPLERGYCLLGRIRLCDARGLDTPFWTGSQSQRRAALFEEGGRQFPV